MKTLQGQVLLWTGFAALVIHCVTSTELQDVGEEDDFEKDLQLDGMSIADHRQFMKQYGQLRRQEIPSQTAEKKDNSEEDDMLVNELASFHSRYKRHAQNGTYEYSGDDDPCNTTNPVCNTTQNCVHNHDNAKGYECKCKAEYDPDPVKVCVPIPDSRRLYLTTTLEMDFLPTYNNPNSLEYKSLKLDCEEAFTDVFKGVSGFTALNVSSFRNESTVVVYSVMFTVDVSDYIMLQMGQAVLKMEQYGYLKINTKDVSIKGYTGIFRTLNETSSNTGGMDWCSNPSLYSCDNSRVCVNTGLRYRCDCQKGYVDVSGECIVQTEMQYDMYAYGASANDQVMAKGDDDVQRVDISAGLPVANTHQYTAYVGINGLITFGSRDSGLSFQIDRNKMMLSPYMADIITLGTSGNVWYHVYTQRSQNRTLFDKASSEVQEFLQLGSTYKTKLVMVITWDKVSPFGSMRPDTERVTFQTVLVSDGTTTYALVYYKTNCMKWVYRRGTKLIIGHSDGKGFESKVNVYSNTAAAFTSLGTIKGNTGRRGMWIYKVGEKYSPDQECDEWYTSQSNNWLLTWMNWILPQCPCSSWFLGFGWVPYRYENGALCYRLSASRSWQFYPYGRDCCYREVWGWWWFPMTLVMDMPTAGGITRYNPSFPELLDLNKRYDRDPHDTCCYKTTSMDYCRKYYDMRPIGWCLFQFWFQSSWFIGDPHIITLDGKEYTFNGWGEYTMVTINNINVTFTLQGRTSKVLTENGTETDATVFTAFAARESSTNVFVQLDPNDNKSLIVYALDKDYSIQFRGNPDFMMESRECTLKRSNTSLSVSFPSEIEIIITPGIKLLDITVNMPNKFRNQTAGLMGNFNGDPSDDFILPNGTVLSTNLTERQIFETFGSLWAVSDNESVFRYEERQGPANFRHYNFTPIFLDEMSDSELNEAIKVCGSKNNTACVYDFMATGNKAIAEATLQSKESADKADLANKNSIPELNVTNTINVAANTSYTFTLKGSDADAKDVLTYYVADNVIGNVALNNSTGEVTYVPNPSQPANLSFYVVDSQSASSPIRTVVVFYCTNCSGHGTCDYTTARPNSISQSFQLAVCKCTTGWTGDECEKDFNGCLETPCISGQNCTDLTPDQQVALGRGYNCSACPLGYDVNNVTNKCEDVNECNTTTHGCSQECSNTDGSYFCTCRKGYRLNTNGRSCDDINECAEKSDNCRQICNNIDGGYNCSCEPGYNMDVNGTCIQELTALQICANANCSQGCKVENKTAECFCMPGYTINTTNKTRCDDIDECSKKICSQGCNNSVGSFTCSCYAGFQLEADGTTCSPCPSLQYGPGCLNTCECNGRGTACNPVTGCVCQSGWRGTNCQEDVNECEETPNICGSTLQFCVNTNGSYRCDCLQGYTKNSAGLCEDVNECESGSGLNTCGSLEVCTNTVGSFYCQCRTGYFRDAGNCTDVDECLSGVATCEQVCENTPGSYNCKCKYGFRLNADRVTCSQVQDVCLGEEHLQCAHGCTLNSNDRAVCFCRAGYKLGTDLQACIDIDECHIGTANCSHICTNLPGSFVCTCPVGYYLQTDQKTCKVCETGTFGVNCTSQCSCGVGALNCDHVSGCVCKPGWMGLTCDQDINECALEVVADECQNKSAICDNDPGSYRCSCRPGYRKDSTGVCQDINECVDSPCSQICENNAGSYRCLCNAGFSLNLETSECEDYNECLLSVDNQCTQECINTDGGYRCSCNQFGYVLANDGYSCTARDVCAPNNCSVTNGGCSVLNGTDTCFCNTGYNWTGTECVLPVVDWCSRANCNQTCHNLNQHPYYKCDCNSGFQLNTDGKTCRRCAPWTYGNCSTSCTCNPQHSINCSNTNGTCLCADGWTGPTCDLDIDECSSPSTFSCPSNSRCVNTAGSYICVCAIGYFQTASGNCSACSGYTYGESCALRCSCSAVNTASCDNVNGTCYCKTGWTGKNCTEDINECTQNSYNCPGQNINCSNTDGSYECVCNKGYAFNDSRICVDLNECLDEDANDCLQNCTNNLGGYTCSCWPGYNGTGNNCTDIDECTEGTHNCYGLNEKCRNKNGSYDCVCQKGFSYNASRMCVACHNNTYGDNCTQTCNCSSVNTVSCDNVNGTCFCRPGWNGTSCDLDIDECITKVHNCMGNYENCSNMDGGFECVCQPGYYYNSSKACVVCSNYTYGYNCNQKCNCSSANTLSCDHVNGTCYCKPGWTGISCDLDIDECSIKSQNCTGIFEKCSNTNGSFQCVCQPGYHYNSSNSCVACNKYTYGDNCTQTCNCSSVNTLSCGNVNGTCYCRTGWTGTSCDLDIDECTTTAHNCTGNFENCSNTDGGFKCVCQPGYYYNSSNACEATTTTTTIVTSSASLTNMSDATTSGLISTVDLANTTTATNATTELSTIDLSNTSVSTSTTREMTSTSTPSFTNVTTTPEVTESPSSITTNVTTTPEVTESPSSIIPNVTTTFEGTPSSSSTTTTLNATSEVTSTSSPTTTAITTAISETSTSNTTTATTTSISETSTSSPTTTAATTTPIIETSTSSPTTTAIITAISETSTSNTTTAATTAISEASTSSPTTTATTIAISEASTSSPTTTAATTTPIIETSTSSLTTTVATTTPIIETSTSSPTTTNATTTPIIETSTSSPTTPNATTTPIIETSTSSPTTTSATTTTAIVQTLSTTLTTTTITTLTSSTSPISSTTTAFSTTIATSPSVSTPSTDNNEAQYALYPYGTTVNDKQLRGDDDTVILELSTGFPVADTLQYTAYVGINGLITFGSRDSGLHFKIDGSKPMLSPYMTDINTVGNEGRVWYNIYEQRTANGSIFAKVNSEIKEFLQISSYNASLVVIVTWDKVSHYNSFYPQTEQATFQTVLVSDGTTSYALVYYKTDAMNWVYRQGTPLVIGQSSGKGKSKLSVYSNTREAFTSMGRIKGNTGRIGTWIYKMGEKYSADQECDDWYYSNLQRKAQINSIQLSMPQCPCSSRALRSAWIPYRVQNDVTCYRLNKGESRLFYPYGKDCCYRFVRGNLLLVSDMPDAGGITSNNPSYRELKAMNLLQDKDPHDTCCYKSTSMDYCKKYYELRPIGQCSSSFGFSSSSTFGDPHIITLDGKEYIFNGWGEYTMVKIDNVNVTFTLQGRTGRVVSDNGTETNATVFTAFAARENGSRVFVQLNPNDNKTLIVFAGSENGLELQDLTTAFQNADFQSEANQYTLRKDNSSLSIAFASGIELIITPGTNQTRVLELSVNMPQTFNGQTRGLMGNFNGRPEDDFILINGTTLPANMTEREIFSKFGTEWAVRDNDSVFHYEGQLGPANFRHPTFEPIFLDEMSVNETQMAKAACGENNTACIYDYLVTGSRAFANSTLQAKTLADQTVVTIKNKVPTLKVNETMVVNVNTTLHFTLDGNDEDGDKLTYYMVGDGQGNVILNNTTGDVTYTANLNYNSSLSFYVVDIKNAASPVQEITVVICTGCSQHGKCDLTRVRPNPNSLASQLSVCNCTPGWTGDECDHDLDACAENPCIVGQNCTDRKPGDNETHTCSDCPTGYGVSTNSSKCDDIDECNTNTHGCSHMCNNTMGSYQCSCKYGYRLNTDGRTCDDINECADKTAKCQHICTNTDGHYNCSCESGYKLESNNSCTKENNSDCINAGCNQGCKIVNNTTECFCFTGYTLSPNKTYCIDADECAMGICSQVCNNTVGSFTCSCYSGYKLDIDGTTCVPCPSLQYGQDCQNTCECSGRGTSCSPVNGCVCQDGWKGTHCEVDKDECQENPSTCGTALQKCVNTNGSYRCDCLAGYTKNSSEVCQDVDECADSFGLKCGNLQDCHNTPGSFYCTCKTGYVKNGTDCTDLDECSSGRPVCEQICNNTQGSYNCECRQGFQLDTDRVSCRKITDVCLPTQNCTQGCYLANNQPVCFCKNGFSLKEDNKTCIDIDECSTTKSSCSHNCTNLIGSFTCSCPAGYYLTADRKTCTECEPGTYGVNCSSLCSCGIGASGCNKTTGCVCRSGWSGVNCDQDVNECLDDSKEMECRNKSATCQNTPGGYRCQCQVGYQNITGLCQDINECDSSPCSQRCENTVGSYRCLCNSGFTWNASTSECQDNDECRLSVDNRCKQTCLNTIGSYRCGCNQSGFELANDGYTCTANSICTNRTCNTTFGGCSNINGTETCFCNNGYELVNNTECVLKQVNWCQLANCEQNCSNIMDPPYYKCLCSLGHVLNSDGKTCRPCADWTYGNNCNLNCSCNTLNSYNCSNTDGTCICKDGWSDKNCSATASTTASSSAGTSATTTASTTASLSANTTASASTGATATATSSTTASASTGTSAITTSTTGSLPASTTGNASTGVTATITSSTTPSTTASSLSPTSSSTGISQSTSNTTTTSVTPTTAQSTPGTPSTGTTSTATTTSSSISSSVPPSLTSVIPFGLTIAINITQDISNKSSEEYISLRKEVSGVLFVKLSRTVTALVKVEVTDMRRGSLIIDAEAISNSSKESLASSLAVAVVGLRNETFNISNQIGKATDVRVGNKTVNDVCEAFLIAVSSCPGECVLTSGQPSCKQIEQTGQTDFALIIGLAVGIPLFFIFVAGIAAIIYMRIKWSRQKSDVGSDDGRSNLSDILSRSIPTRTPFWSPWKGVYTPDARSTASSDEYDRHRKRSDFERSPWGDSFGGFNKKDGARPSNFSWDFLYNQLDTDQPFTIRRPVISLSPNSAYQNNQSNDSQS